MAPSAAIIRDLHAGFDRASPGEAKGHARECHPASGHCPEFPDGQFR
jgi:hypothetical protein